MNGGSLIEKLCICVLLCSGFGPAVAVEGAPEARRDPFEKPDMQALDIVESNSLAGPTTAPISIEKEIPSLRAILRSDQHVLINLDGVLVAIGAHYQGFEVASAGDREVVLVSDSERFVVSLDAKDKPNVRAR